MEHTRVGSKYLKVEGESIVLADGYDYAEGYIDRDFYDSTKGSLEGKAYRMIGVFHMRIFKEEGGEQVSKLLMFNFPTLMFSQPTAVTNKNLTLIPDAGERSYMVFKFFRGDKVIVNRSVIKLFDFTETFFKAFNAGKLMPTIPYTELIGLLLKNMDINGQNNLDSPPFIFSAMIGEACRYVDNKAIPFRKEFNNGASEFSYRPSNFRDIARNSSTAAAITFEDMDSMVEASIVRTRYDQPNPESPLEKIMTM